MKKDGKKDERIAPQSNRGAIIVRGPNGEQLGLEMNRGGIDPTNAFRARSDAHGQLEGPGTVVYAFRGDLTKEFVPVFQAWRMAGGQGPVTERVLAAVSPQQLQLALAAQEELSTRDGALRRQWDMRLQRAQYDADLAQRRYEQVDPQNRLVAASLESRWNAALMQVDEIRRQRDEFCRQQTRTFTEEQRQRILALAHDFPRLWHTPATRAKDKKRMLRLLVEDITVERGEDRRLGLHIRWTGGAREDLLVTLPAKVQDRLRYPTKRIKEIRELAAVHTDLEIADLLNSRGQRSSRDKRFTAKMIGWIRYQHRIAAVELKRRDELTVAELAAKLSVSHGVVYYWIERGILPAPTGREPALLDHLDRGQSPGIAKLGTIIETDCQGVDETSVRLNKPERKLKEVHYAQTVGMPSGRCFPSGLGMYTRRTACGWYVFFPSSSASSSSHFSTPYASMCSNDCPSTPGAPPFARQRRQAAHRTSCRYTLS